MALSKKAATAPWRTRIVGYSDEAPDQLIPSPSNWRTHPPAQQEALLGVLQEAGIVQNILVNRTTGHLIDGHLRVSLALREGQPTVPVTWVELTEHEEKLVLAVLDPIATLAGTDKEKLDILLHDVTPQNAALAQMLSELAAKEGIIPPDFQPVGIEEQGRLDEKAKVTCPECGAIFEPKG